MSVKDRVLQIVNGKVTPKPFPGEQRTFRKFLWFPKKMPVYSTNGPEEWRWLDFEYIRCTYQWNAGGLLKEDGWVEEYFVD